MQRQFYKVLNNSFKLNQLTQNQLNELKQELWNSGVIVLQDQNLTHLELSDFTAQFGEQIILHPDLAFGNQFQDARAVARVGNIREDDSIILNSTAAEYWHQDGDFWQPKENFIINFLYGVQIPQIGGNTGFRDTQTALKRLDQKIIDKLTGSYVEVKASEIQDFQKADQANIPPDAQHQIIYTHPFNGQLQMYALTPIPGMNMVCQDGSLYPFTEFHKEIEKVVEIVEHQWQKGDVLIWDNLQCIHRSMGGYGNNRRQLWRAQSRIKY